MNNATGILIDNLLITLFYEDAVSHVKQVAAGIKWDIICYQASTHTAKYFTLPIASNTLEHIYKNSSKAGSTSEYFEAEAACRTSEHQ